MCALWRLGGGGMKEGQEDIPPNLPKPPPRTQWGKYLGKCQVMEGACGLWSPARSPRGHTSFSPALSFFFQYLCSLFFIFLILVFYFFLCYSHRYSGIHIFSIFKNVSLLLNLFFYSITIELQWFIYTNSKKNITSYIPISSTHPLP